MAEFRESPLDEPSTSLKQNFCSIINEAVIDGVDELSFPLSDGRVLSIGKDIDGQDEDRVYRAAFFERITGENDKIFRHHTFYHVYASGEVVKSVEVEEEKDLEEIQANRRAQPSETDLFELDDPGALAAFIPGSTGPCDETTSDDPDENILEMLRMSQKDDELGLETASGLELQSVIEIITERVNAARVDTPDSGTV